MEKYYKLSYTVVSLVFLTPFSGYTVASTVNNKMHVYLGQRGIAIVAPLCHLISYIILAVHPPFPVLVVMFVFVGFGNGLIDGAWCAWLGNMQSANQVSGFLQASYALGATVSPLIATAMVTKAGLMWYQFYYIMVYPSRPAFVNNELMHADRGLCPRAGKLDLGLLGTDRPSLSEREPSRSGVDKGPHQRSDRE
jgi:fucose permease